MMIKTKLKNGFVITILSILHLLCDLICGYKVIGILAINFYEYGLFIFIIYNTIAFCFQPLIGLVIDKYRIEKIVLCVSFIFLLLGLFLNIWWLSAIFLGIGNQIFHVAGGKLCTNISVKKSSHLGVFVSLGAIGLAIGGNLYMYQFIPYLAIGVYFVLIIIVMFLMGVKRKINQTEDVEEKVINNKPRVVIIGVLFLLLAVFIRSFLGKIIHYDFEMNLTLLLLLPISSAVGKFIGGFIRDRIGSLSTILISMVVGALILILFDHVVGLMCVGLIMINISMPVTLFELNKLLPRHEGFNFGLLAAILFPGVVIGMLYQYKWWTYIMVVLVSSILAILSMYYVKRSDLSE